MRQRDQPHLQREQARPPRQEEEEQCGSADDQLHQEGDGGRPKGSGGSAAGAVAAGSVAVASENGTEQRSRWFWGSSGAEATRAALLLARAAGQAGLYALALQLVLFFIS